MWFCKVQPTINAPTINPSINRTIRTTKKKESNNQTRTPLPTKTVRLLRSSFLVGRPETRNMTKGEQEPSTHNRLWKVSASEQASGCYYYKIQMFSLAEIVSPYWRIEQWLLFLLCIFLHLSSAAHSGSGWNFVRWLCVLWKCTRLCLSWHICTCLTICFC